MSEEEENQSSEVVEDIHDASHLHTSVDVETEKSSILAFFADYLAAGKPIAPTCTFFRNTERVGQITRKSLDPDDPEDNYMALVEMLYLRPAFGATTSIMSYVEPVSFESGTQEAVVIVSFTASGCISEAFPIMRSEDGKFSYDMEATLDPETALLSEFTNNVLRTMTKAEKSPYPPSDIIDWLMDTGYEIQLFAPYTVDTVDPLCGY